MFFIANFIIIVFGFFLIFSGFFMFFKPEKVRVLIGKAGSTYLINYTELGIRFLVGIAFLVSSLFSLYEIEFKIVGYFLIVSAIILMLFPIRMHNALARQFVKILKPIYLKFFAPLAIITGLLLLYMMYNQIKSFIYLY